MGVGVLFITEVFYVKLLTFLYILHNYSHGIVHILHVRVCHKLTFSSDIYIYMYMAPGGGIPICMSENKFLVW
jgi:hypothetical protein